MTESAQKKRKWDLDDQGQTRPEGTATKISKVDDEFPSKTPSSDQGEAAMNEATAKINAILAQKGLAKKEPTATAAVESQKPNEEGQEQQSEQQQQRQKLHPPPREKLENEFVKNIPINDLKNRYMLTRGATQAQIQRDTGADVTTRGKYYPDKALATDGEPPLYLYVSASSQESLDKAVAQIEDLIANAAVPTVVPPHRQDNHHQQNNHHHPQERPPRKFHEEKIYVGLESTPHFNLRAKIVGPHGAYVKHIQNETGSRVQLKGKGSGFYETATGQEAEDALHVHIT
ncbi:hypothetical protein BDB00DRAFT_519426 [Zychaea mexicana]|uniref:uncharacterized protein n=1 Tax=Zychaea mexicana TaxID=64656 RepID=UPI0022FE784A|nr:uncharacterized protein BDB00DRAFT_519426 [Zychaea mexicana]KAI9491079.1 hypothetical protein BDB00DRAFT_519426 [Zychaea mexicana]